MNFRKFLYFLIACIISLSGLDLIFSSDAFGATGEISAMSTAAKKSKKTKNKKKKTSSRSKSANSKKRGNKSGKKGKNKKKSTKKRTSSKPRVVQPVETPSYDSLTLAINKVVIDAIPSNVNPGGLRVNCVRPDSRWKTAKISLNENFTYLPVTQELIKSISDVVSKNLPDSIANYDVSLTVGNRNLAYYITKVDKLPEQYRTNIPFVVAREPFINPKKGMEGDIVALWHSHGRYFKPGSSCWLWQRPVLFETLEDIYTMSYMLPYIVPMIENAGAYVMLPRERDINSEEVIVDNDTNDDGQIFSQPYYKEMTGSRKWVTGDEEGFIYDLPDFRDTENPFENGTYRQTTTVRSGAPSVAAWYADIPKDGEYAIYVSYKSLPSSTTDARYTVNYSGGSKVFKVNQTMGGGTWIYLGTFPLKAGYSDSEPVVTLSNLSDKNADKILTADAVKIGGGMGNIARSNRRSDIYYDPSTPENDSYSSDNTNSSVDDENVNDTGDDEGDDEDDGDEEGDDDETSEGDDDADIDEATAPESNTPTPSTPKGPAPTFRTSGMPRFLEGARYWLQWAGAPERVYSPYHGTDDYKDDYTSRGHWVNWLAGGSRVLPNREGLNIPVDVVMALHSDAGKRSDDSYVGTLGIYYTNNGDKYVDGTPRINSRMLTDLVMRQITNDIRQTYEPSWTRRSMWDKSYVEARVPEVPTTLIELMSHQNFADMRYGLDPTFRFTVGRAIYKAIGRFMAERKDREFVVQPLPVKDFAIAKSKKGTYRLSWQPTEDPLESTAKPHKYIILERTGEDLGFHKIAETSSTHYEVKVSDKLIHSFRIVAANDGGVSFPSETLAFREGDGHPVLIVNGFTRLSGPGNFSANGEAGFDSENDFGVPYINDISFSGHQTEFRRSAGERFGFSGSNYTSTVIAGNTFDFAAIHGEIFGGESGFVSSSVGAVEEGYVKLTDYQIVDLILGKQKMTTVGRGKGGIKYSAFPAKLRNILTQYIEKGGDLVVSGAYVASDLYSEAAEEGSAQFAEDVLGIAMPSEKTRTRSGRIREIGGSSAGINERTIPYSSTLNTHNYIVENPDALLPANDSKSIVFLEFTDSDMPAGILTRRGKSKIAVMSIPLEAIPDRNLRNSLGRDILKAFN